MEEKGRGVYNYFKTKGITFSEKKLAMKLQTIANKISQGKTKITFDVTQKQLLAICKELELNPRSVSQWLEFLSVPQEIRI